MKTDYKFVDTIEDLTESTLEFYCKPEFSKEAVGSVPKYFVHVNDNGNHSFGLSKFCAFKNISVEEYLATYRHKTDGGKTQKHIAWLTQKDWTPRVKIDQNIRQSFDNWILNFFPNYNLNNASFISLSATGGIKRIRKKLVTPADLLANLKLQGEIGGVGEEIAMKFERQRLIEQGIKNPEQHINQVSKLNSAAGYDILSSTKIETRYIEVKSSLNDKRNFFITENELFTLKTLEPYAYIYLVQINDLTAKQGQVFEVIRDPVKQLKEAGTLTPIAYKAELKH